MFLGRWLAGIARAFQISKGTESSAPRSASRLRTEPLESRALLSISPVPHFGPQARDEAGYFVGPQAAEGQFGASAAQLDQSAGSGANCDSSGSSTGSSSSSLASAGLSTNTSLSASTQQTSTGVATHFVVALASGATVGAATTVQILAEDDRNRVVSDYSGTADLSSSDADATLPASVTFDHGHASFRVTFATQGQQTVSLTDQEDSTLTGTATTNVAEQDVVTHYVLYMTPGVNTGSSVTVHVVAEDVQNDIVPNYDGSATLSSSDGAATLPASVTFDHGHASFQVTLATAGLQSISLTDDSDPSLSGTATTNVAATDVATHFAVFLSQSTLVGSPVTVSLVAEDAQNQLVSSYSGTVDLSSSDASATLPATVTFVNGHASFKVAFATAGQQTVTATDTTDATVAGTANTNVAVVHYTLNLSQGASIGTSVTVQLVAVDQNNHVLSDYDGTANLTTSDTAATLPASVTFTNGRANFAIVFGTAGQQTVTATDSVSGSPVGTATTHVAAPDAATHFVVYMSPGTTTGTPTTVRIVAEDAENHAVTNYTGTANLTSSDPSATLPASVTFKAGQASFVQVTFATAGVQTVTATDASDSSVVGTTTTNVAAPAVATHFVVYLRPGATVGAPTTVLVVAKDAQNHLVTDYSGTVDLSSSDDGATLPASVTFHDGHASFQMTFSSTGQQSVTATDSTNSALTGSAATNVAEQNTSRGGRFRFDSWRGR